VPFDIILVATSADLERYRDSPGLLYRTILREGSEVYCSAGRDPVQRTLGELDGRRLLQRVRLRAQRLQMV
jgi:hypothetical protein